MLGSAPTHPPLSLAVVVQSTRLFLASLHSSVLPVSVYFSKEREKRLFVERTMVKEHFFPGHQREASHCNKSVVHLHPAGKTGHRHEMKCISF